MRFNSRSNLVGTHATLSPSNYHWINYTDQKLDAHVVSQFAARRGAELHELAHRLIQLGVKLPDTNATLNSYVNDAIGYRMSPEQILFYSVNCYGQADAISFNKGMLRIHDLKTGITHCKMTQLEIYAALFCLEYKVKPLDIQMEFRIYQNDDVETLVGDPMVITSIMDTIVVFDRRVTDLKEEVFG